MPQIVPFRQDTIAVSSGTRYMHLYASDWENTIDIVGQVMSAAGVISNVHLELGTAPGGTAQWTITLMKNEVATAITFTITGSATTGSDTTHSVTIAAADVLAWKIQNTVGTPASSLFNNWYFEIAPITPGVTQLGGLRSWNNSASKYGSPSNLNGGFAVAGGEEYQAFHVVPTAGNFIATYGYQVGATTTATGFTLLLNKNGVDQDGTGGTVDTRVSLSFQNAKGTGGGTYSLPVVAGDIVYMKATVVGTPGTKPVSYSVAFQATNSSEYVIGIASMALLAGGPNVHQYCYWMQGLFSGSPDNSTSELALAIYPTRPMNITKLYAKLVSAPNSGQSRSFTLRKNAADQALTFTIANTATAGNDTANGHKVAYTSGDTLAVKMTAVSSSPAFSQISMSLVTDFPGGGKAAGGGSSGNKGGGFGGLNVQTAGGASFIQIGNVGVDVGITS